MNIILICFSFLSIYFIIASCEDWRNLRLAFIKNCIILGVLIDFITEFLSINSTLNLGKLTLFWLGINLISILIIFILIKIKIIQIPSRSFWNNKYNSLFQSRHDYLSFLVVFLILSITLLTSIISAPNNWDSMTYHLPKVMHWIQNQNVYPYPTNNLRQISFPPGASYLTLQLILLTGNDYFANCIQWLAFLGSIICVSLIIKYLLGQKHQWIGVLLTTCFPMAIMQSMTTQSDLVTAFWILCYTYFIIKDIQNSLQNTLWAALAFSLAILTKPTALIYGLPLTIFFLAKNICLGKWKEKLFKIGIFLPLSLSLSLPHFFRNKAIFDNYLGTDTNTKATSFGVSQSLSSILKNILINLPLNPLRDLINWIHNHILFVAIDDPSINLGGRSIMNEGNLLKYLVPHEDFVGSPIYLITFILGAIFLFIRYRNIIFVIEKQRYKEFYLNENKVFWLSSLTITVILVFLSFSTLLKWTVFHNRLLLSIFLLSIPTSTFLISCNLHKNLRKFILTFISIVAIFYALTPIRHPLISLPSLSPQQQQEQSLSILALNRSSAYFSGSRKELKEPYQDIVDLIVKSKCQYLGLDLQEDTWEYPLWVLLKEKNSLSFWVKHINVKNSSQYLPEEFPSQKLCAIISTQNISSSNPFDIKKQYLLKKEYKITNTKFSENFILYLYPNY